MGDTGGTSTDPVAALAAQVNRFGSGAPAGYQFAPSPFVASGNLDPALAVVALTIYLRRATDAYSQFHDTASQAAITAANQGFADPAGYVTAHMADVTSTIAGFADSLGIAPAAGATLLGVDSTTALLFAAAGLAVWWMMK